jgi:predicted N-acyltransferase
MLEIKIFHSITEIKKEDWDFLTEDNVYMSYEWLKTIEETTVFPSLPYYITINNQGEIICASVCYLEPLNDARIIDRVMLGRLHKFRLLKRISFSPSIICNRQRGDGTHFIFLPGIKHELILLLQNKILDEIEKIAKDNNTSICFLNVIDEEKQLIESLIKRGYYMSMDLPSNSMDVKWSSFDEYKKHLSMKYPYMDKSIRHQLNRNRKSGVVIEQIQNIEDCQGRLFELIMMNHLKYNSSPFWLKSNYFRQIKENFGNNATIYAAIKEGVIIGVSIVLRKGKEAFFSSIGVDHERSKNDLTFFNVGYYEPIKNAANSNVARIYFGRGLYHSKIKRGCIPKDMFIFYKPKNKLMNIPLKIWFRFHKLWMMRKLSDIKKL